MAFSKSQGKDRNGEVGCVEVMAVVWALHGLGPNIHSCLERAKAFKNHCLKQENLRFCSATDWVSAAPCELPLSPGNVHLPISSSSIHGSCPRSNLEITAGLVTWHPDCENKSQDLCRATWAIEGSREPGCHNVLSPEEKYFTCEGKVTNDADGMRARLWTTDPQGQTFQRFFITEKRPHGETKETFLTHWDEVAVNLKHHIPVQRPLRRVQLLPFLAGEAHSHISEWQWALEWHMPDEPRRLGRGLRQRRGVFPPSGVRLTHGRLCRKLITSQTLYYILWERKEKIRKDLTSGSSFIHHSFSA